jgi:hypothetical protein
MCMLQSGTRGCLVTCGAGVEAAMLDYSWARSSVSFGRGVDLGGERVNDSLGDWVPAVGRVAGCNVAAHTSSWCWGRWQVSGTLLPGVDRLAPTCPNRHWVNDTGRRCLRNRQGGNYHSIFVRTPVLAAGLVCSDTASCQAAAIGRPTLRATRTTVPIPRTPSLQYHRF